VHVESTQHLLSKARCVRNCEELCVCACACACWCVRGIPQSVSFVVHACNDGDRQWRIPRVLAALTVRVWGPRARTRLCTYHDDVGVKESAPLAPSAARGRACWCWGCRLGGVRTRTHSCATRVHVTVSVVTSHRALLHCSSAHTTSATPPPCTLVSQSCLRRPTRRIAAPQRGVMVVLVVVTSSAKRPPLTVV